MYIHIEYTHIMCIKIDRVVDRSKNMSLLLPAEGAFCSSISAQEEELLLGLGAGKLLAKQESPKSVGHC